MEDKFIKKIKTKKNILNNIRICIELIEQSEQFYRDNDFLSSKKFNEIKNLLMSRFISVKKELEREEDNADS